MEIKMRIPFSLLYTEKIVQWFERRQQKLHGIKALQNFAQQQNKFRKKYPHYELGAGTYGLPHVHAADGIALRIGSYCSIASGVQIFLGNHHRMDWVSSYPFPAFFEEARNIPDFETSRGNVTIGSDVWLCENCVILSGITIGHGAVVGTGSVVTRDVEPYAVVAGNPARTIRYRFDTMTRQSLVDTAWWNWPESEIRSIVRLLCSDQVDQLLSYASTRASETAAIDPTICP
jgi:chloramphenicol O-acetyltransferase type B